MIFFNSIYALYIVISNQNWFLKSLVVEYTNGIMVYNSK